MSRCSWISSIPNLKASWSFSLIKIVDENHTSAGSLLEPNNSAWLDKWDANCADAALPLFKREQASLVKLIVLLQASYNQIKLSQEIKKNF